MVIPNLIWVALFGVAWCTPETTDFDVYHPHRHNYLVKTTLLGGGNFANKLSPGNLYVWMGIKPVESLRGKDKDEWPSKNPCPDLLNKENGYIIIREIHGPGLYRRGRSIRLWTPPTAYSRTTADDLRSKFP